MTFIQISLKNKNKKIKQGLGNLAWISKKQFILDIFNVSVICLWLNLPTYEFTLALSSNFSLYFIIMETHSVVLKLLAWYNQSFKCPPQLLEILFYFWGVKTKIILPLSCSRLGTCVRVQIQSKVCLWTRYETKANYNQHKHHWWISLRTNPPRKRRGKRLLGQLYFLNFNKPRTLYALQKKAF